MSFACHLYVTRMYSHAILMSFVYTRMSSVCHPYVTCMYSYVMLCNPYVIRMSLVGTRMSSVCNSYVVLPWTDYFFKWTCRIYYFVLQRYYHVRKNFTTDVIRILFLFKYFSQFIFYLLIEFVNMGHKTQY